MLPWNWCDFQAPPATSVTLLEWTPRQHCSESSQLTSRVWHMFTPTMACHGPHLPKVNSTPRSLLGASCHQLLCHLSPLPQLLLSLELGQVKFQMVESMTKNTNSIKAISFLYSIFAADNKGIMDGGTYKVDWSTCCTWFPWGSSVSESTTIN